MWFNQQKTRSENISSVSQRKNKSTYAVGEMAKQTLFVNQAFPTEILKKILERLDIKSLCSAKQTCKHWKNIIDTFKFLENASSKYLVYRMFHFYFSKLDTFNIYNSKNMHIWPNVGKAKMCLGGPRLCSILSYLSTIYKSKLWPPKHILALSTWSQICIFSVL